MASLQAPLTIISDNGSGSHPFQPPAATWFDEDPLHFVALEARPRSYGDGASSIGDDHAFRSSVISGVMSIDSTVYTNSSTGYSIKGKEGDDEDPSEIVKYEAFGLPKDDTSDKNNDGMDDSRHVLSAFDAAKKAAQDNLRTLCTEISVSFPLPWKLATIEMASPSILDDDDTCATDPTVMESRRIPILAKFSPKMSNGMRFLAMQYTPTMVRIATVEGEDPTIANRSVNKRPSFRKISSSDIDGDYSANRNHWTIDLSYHAHPITSKPEQMPGFGGSARNLFSKKKEEGVNPDITSIIGGGILWSARGVSDDRITSLDLIVVATTSVIVYNINITKKQLIKTQIFPHDMAASFWYESTTRTLVIGSYKASRNPNNGGDEHPLSRSSMSLFSEESQGQDESSKDTSFPSAVMEMKTLFFSKTSSIVEKLPKFSIGTLREEEAKDEDEHHELMLLSGDFNASEEKLQQGEDSESSIVLPTEIFLLKLYGSVYCIELGSMGSGQGIGFTKLDREGGCIHVRHQFEALKGTKIDDVESMISVGVLDNLLCIFSKKNETTYFIDVADIFSDDQRLFRESVERFDPDMHDESLSFLAPRYFLDTSGQGMLYEVGLSLPLLLPNVPPTACIIPFLMRRNVPKATIRTHIMGRFTSLIKKRDMPSLMKWIGVIVDRYSKSADGLKFDFESTVSLLSRSSLTSLNDMKDADVSSTVGDIMVPLSCGQVLTQTEMLQMIFLPHAVLAIKKGDDSLLRFVSSFSVRYFVELERRSLTPSIALQCLVVALLWRTGENAELTSFLSTWQTQWTITRRRRQMDLPTKTGMYFDNPGAVPYAEILFKIAVEGIVDKASVRCDPSATRQLISYATTILLGCGATSLAVKCLLSAGRLNDAINVCSKKIRPNKVPVVPEETSFAGGTSSKDFFRAAVSNARKQSSVSERCKTFYLLHCFLQQWDPSALEMDSRQVKVSRRKASLAHMQRPSFRGLDDYDTMMVKQSVLAHDFPRFPDELFGGKESACCLKLRAMFGYVQNVK
mmetsp:Transcript_17028/g.35991  ORF Transcript_17028/g.35991 Transcript_17028/m.35991 type:complete len:1026 (-) Transcript_17028:175-3252(-)